MTRSWGMWRTAMARAAARALALASIVCASGACSQLVVMAEYPVQAPPEPAASAGPADPDPSADGAPTKPRHAYWSVYAHMEEQDVIRLWKVTGLDYLL